MSKPIKCTNCGKYEARTRDYREVDGITGKILSCRWCANLNNVAHYRIRAENLDPVSFYESIDLEKLPAEELQELRDNAETTIDAQLEDPDILQKFIEYERALILREEQPA